MTAAKILVHDLSSLNSLSSAGGGEGSDANHGQADNDQEHVNCDQCPSPGLEWMRQPARDGYPTKPLDEAGQSHAEAGQLLVVRANTTHGDQCDLHRVSRRQSSRPGTPD
jgi:hypothetical protein